MPAVFSQLDGQETKMIVKLIKPWNNWSPGMVFATMQDNVAEVLIQRGVGVLVPHVTEVNGVQPDTEVFASAEPNDSVSMSITERGNQRRRRR